MAEQNGSIRSPWCQNRYVYRAHGFFVNAGNLKVLDLSTPETKVKKWDAHKFLKVVLVHALVLDTSEAAALVLTKRENWDSILLEGQITKHAATEASRRQSIALRRQDL